MNRNGPQLTVLSLAIAAALTSMAPSVAIGQTVIASNETLTQHWSSGDFTVNNGISLTITAQNTAAVYADGNVLGTLTNNGTISSSSGGIVTSGNAIGMLNNAGLIQAGSYYAIANLQSNTQTLDNSGIISGNFGGIYNNGTISTLNNSGTIKSSAGIGLTNEGSIGALNNSGAIDRLDNLGAGTLSNVFNAGTITTLNNSGTLNGAVALINGGSNGTISGTGSIGNLNNTGIINSAADAGIMNMNGAIGTLTNSGGISSQVSQGIFNNSGSVVTTLVNTATGTIAGGSNGAGIFNSGLMTDIRNSGDIHGTNGISNGGVLGTGTTAITYTGTIGTLNNSGTISSVGPSTINNLPIGINNTSGSTIGTLINSGAITSNAVGIMNSGTTGTLTNTRTGTITAGIGIGNNVGNTITTLINDGKISASLLVFGTPAAGIINYGAIVSLSNSQSGVIADGLIGIYNAGQGTIDTFTNNGAISGSTAGVGNEGTLATLVNNGTIESSGMAAILNTGAIQTLTNTNRIHGTSAGVSVGSTGQINVLNNSGAIIGDNNAGINNTGTIGALNNSGLISSTVDAIKLNSGSTLGSFINSGTIAGRITNASGASLSIAGGSGAAFGLLTGASGGRGVADISQISSQGANITFSAGNQLLNDHIDVGAGNFVTNAGGVLQVNNQIIITGAYRQNAAATLNIGAAGGAITNGDLSDIGYGRLTVTGNAVIDAGSSVMLKKVGAYGFANGQRYLVIQAVSTGTNYNESTLHYGATGFNGTVTGSSIADGSNRDLLLTLDGGTANQASTGNAQSTIDGLFRYTGTDPALMNLFNAAAAIGSSQEGDRAGAQLNPASGAAGVAGASAAASQQVNNIAFNRLNSFSSQDGLAFGGTGNGASGKAESGLATGESASDNAVWGQAFAGRAASGSRDGVSGYHANYRGLLAGVDTALNEQWRVGGLVNHATTSVGNDDNNSGSSSHVDAYGLTAYAGYTGEAWYVNLAAGATRSAIDAHRVVDFSGFSGVADGSYHSTQYIASASAGYPLKVNDMIVTPLAGLTYSRLRLDGYTETGGSGAALHVDGSATQSIKSDLGAKLERALKTSYGLLKPSAQLLWRHEYKNTGLQSVSNFAADTSGATSFVTAGPTPVKDTGALSLGLTLLRNDNLTLSVNYTLEHGGGYTSQNGDLLARWRF